MTIQQQLDSFCDYVNAQIAQGCDQLSLFELFQMWEVHVSLTPQELAASAAAVQEALDAMHAGDRGITLEELDARIRSRFGLVSEKTPA